MRIVVKAKPGEIEAKATDLVAALVERLAPHCDVREALAKAGEASTPTLKFPVLRGLQAEAGKAYRELLGEMITEIAAAIDGSGYDDHTARVSKSAATTGEIHTWHDGSQWQKQADGSWTPVSGTTIKVQAPPEIAGGYQRDYQLGDEKDDQVRVNVAGYQYGQWMPKASVRHFMNDLHGRVEVPPSDNPAIEAVRTGQAQLLGKGDDGIAFKVGDRVVKVSTTVPYQPENPGHRSPEQAVKMLEEQSKNTNAMIKEGVPGLLPSEFVKHGDKGFEFKDHVQVLDKLTPDQLEQVHDTLQAMHDKGWILGDQPQVGLDRNGKVVMFDVGKAEKDSSKVARELDKSALERLYRDNGQVYLPRGEELEENWAYVHDHARLQRAARSGLIRDMLIPKLTRARDGKIAEAQRKYKGADLELELEIINEDAAEALKILNGGQ